MVYESMVQGCSGRRDGRAPGVREPTKQMPPGQLPALPCTPVRRLSLGQTLLLLLALER